MITSTRISEPMPGAETFTFTDEDGHVLRDANGNPITLDPGQTWVVMAEEAPGIR